jgi:hypothetical protein
VSTRKKSKRGAADPALPSREDICRELARQRNELRALLESSSIPEDDAKNALALVRDAIAIDLAGTVKSSLARAGGTPDLPSESDWPRGKAGPLDFIAQIPLEQVAPLDVHDRLPASGLLSFFVGHFVDEATGELEVESAVLHIPTEQAVSPRKPPKGAWKSKGRALSFRPLAVLPPHGSRFFQSDRVDGRYAEAYDERAGREGVGSRQAMLCFDRPFEAKLGADDVILLRVDLDGDISYDFEEMSVAYFVITKADLTARRWGSVRAIEGGSI